MNDNADSHWTYHDSKAVDSSRTEARIDEFQQEQDGPDGLRFWLFTFSENRHILVVRLPALCADSDTIDKIVRELSKCYGGALSPDVLDNDVVQYADYCAWKEELLAATDATRLRAGDYWSRVKESPQSTVTLPFQYRIAEDAPRTAQSFVSWVKPETVAAIDSTAERKAYLLPTLFMRCLGGLAARSGQQEIIMAAEVAPEIVAN